MSSTKPGFYTNPLLIVNDGNAFENNFTITPSLSNNNATINYSITSNRPGITIGYNVVDLIDSNYFTSPLTGNITLDGNGNGSVSFNANIGYNYANTDPVSFTFNICSQYHRSSILAENTNVTLVQPTQISATGGTITETDSGNGYIYAGYKIHTFTSNANLVISNLGNNSELEISTFVLGGGGGGGRSYTRNTVFFNAFQAWDRRTGSGGGGGGANTTSISISGLSTTNYPVIVGAGGTTGYSGSSPFVNPGSASSVLGIIGGGGGRTGLVGRAFAPNVSGVPYCVSTTRAGKSGSPQDNLGGFAKSTDQGVGVTRVETFAGGGASALADGGNASCSGPGGNGANGITTDITGTSITYGGAGGGGGMFGNGAGTGGTGGGGNGANGSFYSDQEGFPATFYGGGGGGAGSSGYATNQNPVNDKKGGAGYQGIVILRYLHKYKNFSIT